MSGTATRCACRRPATWAWTATERGGAFTVYVCDEHVALAPPGVKPRRLPKAGTGSRTQSTGPVVKVAAVAVVLVAVLAIGAFTVKFVRHQSECGNIESNWRGAENLLFRSETLGQVDPGDPTTARILAEMRGYLDEAQAADCSWAADIPAGSAGTAAG